MIVAAALNAISAAIVTIAARNLNTHVAASLPDVAMHLAAGPNRFMHKLIPTPSCRE